MANQQPRGIHCHGRALNFLGFDKLQHVRMQCHIPRLPVINPAHGIVRQWRRHLQIAVPIGQTITGGNRTRLTYFKPAKIFFQQRLGIAIQTEAAISLQHAGKGLEGIGGGKLNVADFHGVLHPGRPLGNHFEFRPGLRDDRFNLFDKFAVNPQIANEKFLCGGGVGGKKPGGDANLHPVCGDFRAVFIGGGF